MSPSTRKSTIMTIVVMMLIALAAAAVAQTHSTQSAPGPHLPLAIQPLRVANLMFDLGMAPQSIHTLDESNIAYFSTTQAVSKEDPSLYPFGKTLDFSFSTQTPQSINTLGLDSIDEKDLLFSTELHQFKLEIDESPIFSRPDRHTFTQSAVSDEEQDAGIEGEKAFTTHTSFKGRRINSNGQEEILFLTITPNSGDYRTTDPERIRKGDLETQSIIEPQVFDALSGRMEGQFTVIGYLFSGNRMFEVTTFGALEYQLNEDINNVEYQIEKIKQQQDGTISQQDIDMKQQTIDTFSVLLSDVADQRSESRYDLVLIEIDNSTGFKCGNKDHSEEKEIEYVDAEEGQTPQDLIKNGEAIDEEFVQFLQNPLATTPNQILLAKWATSCHPYMDRTVVFSVRIFASIGYQRWASNVGTSGTPNAGRVSAHVKLLLQVANKITQEQMSYIYKLADIVSGPSSGGENWNSSGPSDTTRCDMDSNPSPPLAAVQARRLTNLDVSSLHGFLYCSGTGTVGLAALDVLCSSTHASGVSSINGSKSIWTFLHEMQGHQHGISHPFGSNNAKQGTYGGIMDYKNVRLPETDSNPKRYGFNQSTDNKESCAGLSKALSANRGSLIPAASCFEIDNPSLIQSTCGDGEIQPWEECDSTSKCCQNCKLVSGATCGTEDECCVDCQSQGQKRCSMPGDSSNAKTGLCMGNGVCKKSQCSAINSFTESGYQCADNYFFYDDNEGIPICRYWCSKTSDGCGSATSSDSTRFEPGTPCKTADVPDGVCVQTQVFNGVDLKDMPTNDGTTCVARSTLTYAWKQVLVSPCKCDLKLQPVSGTVCLSSAGGVVVSSSFCSSSAKPATPLCPSSCGAVVPSDAEPCEGKDCDEGGDGGTGEGNNGQIIQTIISLLVVVVTVFVF